MRLPYLLLDIDGVLIPFPDAEGASAETHTRHDVVPTGRTADNPVTIWLNPAHGPLLMHVIRTGLVTPVWCTGWREDATTLIGPLLGLPPLPHVDLPRPQITTSHPKRLPVETRPRRRLARRRTSHLDRRRLHRPRPRVGEGAHRSRPGDRPGSA